MPRRDDISSVLVIGSGPIVIGQAVEFDYSGAQACRVLRREGYRVILVNSNPATIMTDPDFADRTYVEPLTLEVLEAVIERERPDALLPTLGGQTALNLAMELHEAGALERFGVEMIGAKPGSIRTAEQRDKFKAAMGEIGLAVPRSGFVHEVGEALAVGAEIGYPIMVRPSFILGGAGTGIAYDAGELERLAAEGIAWSPVGEVLIEQSIAGWKEFELEVMRDCADNCVVVCSIENLDAMGVHTGDSITVAPVQTLSDVEYQVMRDAAFACIRRIGVDTGGSNIQFAVNPEDGAMVVIEMNPRVSRSSALASKATGFPIAKIAAHLAVGYRLDEIVNDITGETPASFEPAIDYVVTKVPRFAFEKLPGAPERLGTRMQSVGEVMAIGRSFAESLQKALRSLEQGRSGLGCDPAEAALDAMGDDELLRRSSLATPDRLFAVEALLRRRVPVQRVSRATGIDPWFLDRIAEISAERLDLGQIGLEAMGPGEWLRAKRLGFSDAQLAWLWGAPESVVAARRTQAGVRAQFKTVDTCAAEFQASTPYYYSTYDDEDEVVPGTRPSVVILGSGPNRIGQGVEFDYCCVHASFALRDAGFDTVMVNCNPETVSTDYDTSDRLYFEPLTYEDVMNVLDAESRAGRLSGIIVSLGGQTPLKLAGLLPPELVLGTSPDSIDLAEDRERWNALCGRLGLAQPAGGTARSLTEALAVAGSVGYPVLVRPSYVLGGRAMEIVYDDRGLRLAIEAMTGSGPSSALAREGALSEHGPVLVDQFLEDATEVDVDAIRDGTGEVLIGAVMEHVEDAGVHSGDAALVIPPPSLARTVIAEIEDLTRRIAEALEVKGLVNVQFAVKRASAAGGESGAAAGERGVTGAVYVLEANPRASRTVPFVAKATGVPLAKIAARVCAGATLAELRTEGLVRDPAGAGHVSVKESVFPFNRFPGVDSLLGPEMRSTGEVMGVARSYGLAFAKSQAAAGSSLPAGPGDGAIFLSLADRDKADGVVLGRRLAEMGFEVVATEGTAARLADGGVKVSTVVRKLGELGSGLGPDAVSLIAGGKICLVVNTPMGRGGRADGAHIRAAAIVHKVACLTTAAAALAAVAGIAEQLRFAASDQPRPLPVMTLQELHRATQLRLDI
ncbi:MAG: carbamoyl-phosphate synthase large subunit [Acidimicrobiales bacterium]